MGFIKQSVAKLTGADVAADIAERQAIEQAAAIRDAAAKSAQAAQEAAVQSARQQQEAIAREQATKKAAELTATATKEVAPEVALDEPEQSQTKSLKARRQKFGIGSSSSLSGVSI